MDQTIRYLVAVDGQEHSPRSVTGSERVSTPTDLAVELLLANTDPLEPDEVSGARVEVIILRGAIEHRRIGLTAVEVARRASNGGTIDGCPVTMRLVSPIWLLRHNVDIRVFRDKDVPTIVTEVLSAHGIPTQLRLSRAYRSRPYTVQYRESDLDFVSRLLEDEGIFYLVNDDGSVALADGTAYEEAPNPLPFRLAAGALDDMSDALLEYGESGTLGADYITLRGFDFEKPKLDVSARSAMSPNAQHEVYRYAGSVTDGEAATAATTNFTDAERWKRETIVGRLTAPWARVGLQTLFEGALGVEHAQVLTALSHAWRPASGGFSLAYEGTDARLPIRPSATTPRPAQTSVMIAKAVGPEGADIHTDPWGRVKLHFPWDRLQPRDDNASHWVPTLQDNTGQSIGIPRVGWEMLVAYAEGDPDRPMILGRLYNGGDPHYAVLPSNKTWTALRSLPSPRPPPGMDEHNLIQFEDRAQRQRFYVHAERDRTIEVEHDKLQKTATLDTRVVDRDESIRVGASRAWKIAVDHETGIGHDATTVIGRHQSIKVGAEEQDTVQGDRTIRIGSSHTRRIESTDSTTTSKSMSERVGALDVEIALSTHSHATDLAQMNTVGGAYIELAKGDVNTTTSKLHVVNVGGILLTKAKEQIASKVSGALTRFVGGKFSAKAGVEVVVSGVESLHVKMKSGALTAKKKITMTVGESKIVFENDLIAIDAPLKAHAIATAKNDLNAAVSGQNDRKAEPPPEPPPEEKEAAPAPAPPPPAPPPAASVSRVIADKVRQAVESRLGVPTTLEGLKQAATAKAQDAVARRLKGKGP